MLRQVSTIVCGPDCADRSKQLKEIAQAAYVVCQAIDQNELAMHYGKKLDPDDAEAAKKRKQMDQQKEILIDALYRMQLVLLEMKDVQAAEQNYKKLKEWVDPEDPKYAEMNIKQFLLKVMKYLYFTPTCRNNTEMLSRRFRSN